MMQVPPYFRDVNYSDSQVIIEEMKLAIAATRDLPLTRGIKIMPLAHCTAIQYGPGLPIIGYRSELLGHLPVLAEIVARVFNDGRTFFQEVGYAAVMVSAQDIIAHGFVPDSVEDVVCLHQYSWGRDNPQRLCDLRLGFEKAAKKLGSALSGGETGSLRYLINPLPDIGDAPVIITTTHGSVNPERLVRGGSVQEGDAILGARSTGLHANAISAVIRLPRLAEMLQERLSDGRLFGEAVMAEMGCYLDLVNCLMAARLDIHAMMAGSGGGVSKLAFDKRQLTYRIQHWPEPLPILQKLLEHIPPYDFLKEFNAGVGWFVFLPKEAAKVAIEVGQSTRTPLMRLGEVQDGKRGVDFKPEEGFWREVSGPGGIWLEPQEF